MIPLRPASLFRSRRAALLYAAGILWFALDVAGEAPKSPHHRPSASSPRASGTGPDEASVATLQNALDALPGG